MIDVIKLSEAAGFVTSKIFGPLVAGRPVGDELERFAALVLEEAEKNVARQIGLSPQSYHTGTVCIAAIRALKPAQTQE